MNTGPSSHHQFAAMGTRVDLWIGGVPAGRARSSLLEAERFIRRFEETLTRFDPRSELCLLNRDKRETVPASDLMLRWLDTALWAAQASGGLVDPTVLPALREAGYERTRVGAKPASLADAIEAIDHTAPAAADRSSAWTQIQIDHANKTVTRPIGTELDPGGTGKGLAVDMLAERWSLLLGRGSRFVIDCGGDIRVGGEPVDVEIEPPPNHFAAEPIRVCVGPGAIATSGLGNRVWRNSDGAYSHHLIDPASGRPAWTGLTAVTQLAPTAVVAETIAKTALLSGADVARRLAVHDGGILFHFDGSAERVGIQAPTSLAAVAA